MLRLGERNESGLKAVPVSLQWDLPQGGSPATWGGGRAGKEGGGIVHLSVQ